MRRINHAHLNCIRSGFGFGRNAGGMGDALRQRDALHTRLYCAKAPAVARAAKAAGVESGAGCAGSSRELGHGHPSMPQASQRPRQIWRLAGPTVSPTSTRIS